MSSIPSAHGIDHVGFTVPHLGNAIDFLGSVFGAETGYELGPIDDPDGSWMRHQLGVPDRAVGRAAMLRLNQAAKVEVVEYRSPGEPAAAPRHGDWGASHLALRVEDLRATTSRLERVDGVRVIGAPPADGADDVWVGTPIGLLLQLRQGPATVDHVGITVPDLPRAERFFRERIGAELVHRDAPVWLDTAAMARCAIPAAGIVERSRLRLGGACDVVLQQFELPGQRQLAPSNADHGGHHIAIGVHDIAKAGRYLGELREVEPLGTPQTEQRAPIAGAQWQYFRTSWGLHVELVDLPPGVPFAAASADRSELGAVAAG